MPFLINLFIIFILLFILFWDFPETLFPKKIMNKLATPISYFGLNHRWRMYAPNPASFKWTYTIEGICKNGSVIQYIDPIFENKKCVRVISALQRFAFNDNTSSQYRLALFCYKKLLNKTTLNIKELRVIVRKQFSIKFKDLNQNINPSFKQVILYRYYPNG